MDPPTMPVVPASRMVCATISGLSPKPFARSAWTGRSTAAAIRRALSSINSRVARPTASGRPRVAIAPKLVVSISGTPTWASRQAVPTSQQAADRVGSAPAWSAWQSSAFSFVLLINGTPGWQLYMPSCALTRWPARQSERLFPDKPLVKRAKDPSEYIRRAILGHASSPAAYVENAERNADFDASIPRFREQ